MVAHEHSESAVRYRKKFHSEAEPEKPALTEERVGAAVRPAHAVGTYSQRILKARVHCMMCSRAIANVMAMRMARQGTVRLLAVPGQRCDRCRNSLDAGKVLELMPALELAAPAGRKPNARHAG